MLAPRFHGLDVAAAVGVVLVGERKGTGGLVRGPVLVAADRPFVPSRNKDNLGVEFESALPLLLEIPAVKVRVGAQNARWVVW